MADPALSPRDIASAGLCIGCGACAADKGAMVWDGFGQLKPDDAWAAAPSSSFGRICPFSAAASNETEIADAIFPDAAFRDPRIGAYEAAYVGSVAEDGFRAGGSSGGMTSWVAAELLRSGLIDGVAHVRPVDPERDGRFFAYRISRSVAEVRAGTKSRYYPVDLSSVLAEIREIPGRYAVVGLPCFIKAIRLLQAEDPILAERIHFTLGLFCGHMKSARLVESIAWQLGANVEQVRAVDYRLKNPDRPANWYTAHLTLVDGSSRSQDWWNLADGDWGASFFQNSACDYCDDVVAETADICFGDAWLEPYSSDGRGTNVVIVRNAAIHRLVQHALSEHRLDLASVDQEFVVETQAAGLRHRREGLAYRLAIDLPSVPLRKRVAPGGLSLPVRRKLVYRARRAIARLSHPIAALAHRWRRPNIYVRWARTALHLYQAITYSRGPLGRMIARCESLSIRLSAKH